MNNIFEINYCGNEVKFYLPTPEDHIQKQILNTRTFYEKDLLEEIGRLPLAEGIICDIGANIANHTLYFSKILKRQVYAFEPGIRAIEIAKKNIGLNDVESEIQLFQFALGSKNGRAEMELNELNLGASKLKFKKNGDIQIKVLDDVLPPEVLVSLLKIDVEGFEMEVLGGAKRTIETHKPIVVIETQTHQDFLNISKELSVFNYAPIGFKGATTTVFFVHSDIWTKVNETQLMGYLIRNDIDSNHKTSQLSLNKISKKIDGIEDLRKDIGVLNQFSQTSKADLEKKIDGIEDLRKDIGVLNQFSQTSKADLEKKIDGIESLRNIVNTRFTFSEMKFNALESKVTHANQTLGQIQKTLLEQYRELVLWQSSQQTKTLNIVNKISQFENINEKLIVDMEQYINTLERTYQQLKSKVDFFYSSKTWRYTSAVRSLFLPNKKMTKEDYFQKVQLRCGDANQTKAPYLSTKKEWVKSVSEMMALRASLVSDEKTLYDSSDIVFSNVESKVFNNVIQIEKQPLVVVFIPVFNAEDTIEESISSIREQSYKNIQIIAIDDQSTDNSIKVLRRLANKYNNLSVLQSPHNGGTYSAVNYGLFMFKFLDFEFFTIHGADDVMLREKIELQISKMENENKKICITGYRRVKRQSRKLVKTVTKGHSMVIYRKSVFLELGFYDNTTFGGDSEYLARCRSKYGVDNECYVEGFLTDAYVHGKNITQSNPDDSKKRLDYVEVFSARHAIMSETNDWFVEGHWSERDYARQIGKKVVCGVATLKNRKEALRDTVLSILPQVDELIVYQNGYKEIFEFLKHEKIKVISSFDTGIDMGDAGKFYHVDKEKGCYYFSIDDDLIYPSNYVNRTLEYLRKYANEVIVTSHGRKLKPGAVSYYKDSSASFPCLHDVEQEEFIHFGGTGVMAFDTSVVKIDFAYFKRPNMGDIWMGLYARENSIPILVFPHKRGWIKHSDKFDMKTTIFETSKDKDHYQNELIKGFDATKIISI